MKNKKKTLQESPELNDIKSDSAEETEKVLEDKDSALPQNEEKGLQKPSSDLDNSDEELPFYIPKEKSISRPIVAAIIIFSLAIIASIGASTHYTLQAIKESSYKAYADSAAPVDFVKTFAGKYAGRYWCSIGSDGSYIFIDTNPDNVENHTDGEAIKAINDICKTLMLPESVIEKMNTTYVEDGRMTHETADYIISWRNGVFTGLEVIFEGK